MAATLRLEKNRSNYESSGDYGQAPMHGAMAEYVLRSAAGMMKVPDNVSDEEAALIEPFNVGLSAVNETGMMAGDSVAIIGGGHIGQLVLLAAKAEGAAPIVICVRDWDVIHQCVSALRREGTIVLLSFPAPAEINRFTGWRMV